MLLAEAAYIAFKVYILLVQAFLRNQTHDIGVTSALL